MKSMLRELSVHYAQSNNSDQKLTRYVAMRQHEGWEVHQEMLLILRRMIADEMLSEKHTRLDAHDKDVAQRAYYQANELISFLLNPLELATKRAQFSKEWDRKMQAA